MHSIEQSLASSTLRWAHAVFLAGLSSHACLASGYSTALCSWVRWQSVASLVCLATGCSAALRMCRQSSLACLTSVCSNLLCSWSLWRQCCSLAVALSSRSRRNLFLALSRFIGVELHGEESFVLCMVRLLSTCAKSYPF